MVEKTLEQYCQECKKETLQIISEDALEIKYHCTECETEQNTIKTFF